MIELLYLNAKATMNVPLIPPLSVIETLILSKRFWLKAIFFYLSLSDFDRRKRPQD
jgi:hypothetical protein